MCRAHLAPVRTGPARSPDPWQPSVTSVQGVAAIASIWATSAASLSLARRCNPRRTRRQRRWRRMPRNPAQRPAQRGAGKLGSRQVHRHHRPQRDTELLRHRGLHRRYPGRIRQVFADRVIIARDGRDETLMLDGEGVWQAPAQTGPPGGTLLRAQRTAGATRARSPITSIFLRSGWTVA